MCSIDSVENGRRNQLYLIGRLDPKLPTDFEPHAFRGSNPRSPCRESWSIELRCATGEAASPLSWYHPAGFFRLLGVVVYVTDHFGQTLDEITGSRGRLPC